MARNNREKEGNRLSHGEKVGRRKPGRMILVLGVGEMHGFTHMLFATAVFELGLASWIAAYLKTWKLDQTQYGVPRI